MRKHSAKRAMAIGAAGLVGIGAAGAAAKAQSAATQTQAAANLPRTASSVGERVIVAESAPYRIEWNGASGTLIRRAMGEEPELRSPLVYLHSDAGPSGYAKHLAWFLARESGGFSLLWCYLNDDGQEFHCWMYRYPANQLTTLRFTGEYRFLSPEEPKAPTIAPNFQLRLVPQYVGPNFAFQDWKRQGGTLSRLALRNARPTPPTRGVSGFAPPVDPTTERTGDPATPPMDRTLSDLQVFPLHEIHVASANGWRADGWRELHSVAFDAARDPYYLIQYSNSTRGYVVDLKRATVSTSDFGSPVRFALDPSIYGSVEQTLDPTPEIRVRRFARHEIVLATNQDAANPFQEVTLEAEFRSPNGKRFLVPGFWDGGRTFRVRLAPTQVGTWSWRTLGSVPELNGQTGTFECVSDDAASVAGRAQGQSGSRPRTNVVLSDSVPRTYGSGSGFGAGSSGQSDSQNSSGQGNGSLDDFRSGSPGQNALSPASAFRPQAGGGFLRTATPALDSHQFAHTNGVPFLPVYLRDPVQSIEGERNEGGEKKNDELGMMNDESNARNSSLSSLPASFVTFQRRIDAAADMGFNRLIGGYLLDKRSAGQAAQANEGGVPFLDGDIARPNPAYFQWMDRRIAYCNAHGIVPDIGLGWPNQGLFTRYNGENLRRVWRYVVARYAAYDVVWNLFGRDDAPAPADTDARLETYAALTRLYDPIQHPFTSANLGPLTISTAALNAPANVANDSGSDDTAGTPSRPRRRPVPAAPVSPYPSDAFGVQDTITQVGGDLRTLDYLYRFDKPILLAERPASAVVNAPAAGPTTVALTTPATSSALSTQHSALEGMDPDIARQRLWETRMRGAFWAGGQAASRLDAPSGSAIPELDYAASCARFFRSTRFWRLEPHPEVLGGPEETSVDRRRRKKAQADATKDAGSNGAAPPGSPTTPANAPAPANGVTQESADSAIEATMPKIQNPGLPDGVPILPTAPTLNAATNPVFILSEPAWEYVVYFEQGGQATLDLLEATGTLKMRWFNPRLGQFLDETTLPGGEYHTFTCPDKNDWVLHISRR